MKIKITDYMIMNKAEFRLMLDTDDGFCYETASSLKAARKKLKKLTKGGQEGIIIKQVRKSIK
jgi:hypothetical protein